MASSSLMSRKEEQQREEEDLIDLEAVAEEDDKEDDDTARTSRMVAEEDRSSEELEHLLDVCPPELEEKLSLTRNEESLDNGGPIKKEEDEERILVRLGHDKLVPRQKRIDVVSCETIKRIRDITKNLEPVIRNCGNDEVVLRQDADTSGYRCRTEETVETVEKETTEEAINMAFNFLSDLDDDSIEDEYERSAKTTKRGKNRHRSERDFVSSLSSCYPLEPTCLVRDGKSNRSSSLSSSSNCEKFLSDGKVGRVCRKATEEQVGAVAADDSTASCSSECSEVDWSWVAEYETRGNKNSVNGCGMTDVTADESADRRTERRSKVQVGGSDNGARKEDGGERSKREARVDIGVAAASGDNNEGCSSVAMSVVGVVGVVGTGKRQRRLSRPVTTTASRSFSSASDDIEIFDEATRRATTTTASTNTDCTLVGIFPNDECDVTRTNGFHVENDQTILVTDENSLDRRCRVRGGGNENVEDDSTSSPRISWLRASMRRLRHLRLPEAVVAGSVANSDARIDASEITLRGSSLVPLCAPTSLPDISLIAAEVIAARTNSTTALTRDNGENCESGGRPSSAPVYNQRCTVGGVLENTAVARDIDRNAPAPPSPPSPPSPHRDNNNSRAASLQTNHVSRVSSAGASQQREEILCSVSNQHAVSVITGSNNAPAARRICERPREPEERVSGSGSGSGEDEEDEEDENGLGRWPHTLSPALACLGCTLGLFNISRFASLSIQFGANFIVQFLVLSLILGIPLLTLQVCLGQRLGAGALDMWRISPIFHGVGIALLVAQASIGIYSIIGVSWMFVYFRDSFITKQERYRWAEPFLLYRGDQTKMLDNSSGNYKLEETVPDYFSGVVLQRHHINEPDASTVTLKFQVAFNLAVVWMIVFVSLSKGLRSYGKVVYVLTLVPVFGTLVLCTKLLGLTPPGSINQLFPATVWSEFFINGKSWLAASSEVFLTWGLFGAAAMQIAAHNRHKHLLQRDTSLVVVLTIVVLLLSAFLANTCVQILQHYGYSYITSSFERTRQYAFMRNVKEAARANGFGNTPERFMSHGSFIVGQRVVKPGSDLATESGYQALRLSTELVPATLAILGTEQVSPFWAVLFYFVLILFGIAQQLAIWHCVITGIMAINRKMMKLWETTITFFSCACAYVLGLPMATELGIYVVYYLDYVVGGAWWIMILYLVQVGAVFAVRGRPHTGETVVAELFPPTGRCMRHWAGPLLSFTWNVILPVALMVLGITIFKSSNFRELYIYRRSSRDYWSVWARQLGAAIQLTPILIIPGVAIIQTCRYLNSGPPDIFDRIQLLYRPPMHDTNGTSTNLPINYANETTTTSIHGNGILRSSNEPPASPAATTTTTTTLPFQDPPPKYTPPPSYTTATGARIAKMLRQSIRRSVRRIASVLGETSIPVAQQPPPPDYATVLVEMNQSGVLSEEHQRRELGESTRTRMREPLSLDSLDSTERQRRIQRNRPRTIDRTTMRISTIEPTFIERTHSTMDRVSGGRSRNQNTSGGSSNLTAADVANLLRSSIRRGVAATRAQTMNRNGNGGDNDLDSIATDGMITVTTAAAATAASVENLINAAVPINEDQPRHSLYEDKGDRDEDENDDEDEDENEGEKKTVNETERSVSVI